MNNYMSPSREEKFRLYSGPAPVNMLTTRDPVKVMKEIEQTLVHYGILYKKIAGGFSCKREDFKWEMEFCRYQDAKFLHVLKLTRE